MKPRKLLMIVNPRAGKSKSHGPLFDAAAALSLAGYLLSIHVTSAPGDAAETARREGGRYDLVVAVGGDGTLNEVVSGLVQLRRPPLLGYLPQGSTNDFAASLRISGDPAEAAAAIARNVPRLLDVGFWNGRSFLYVASFGAFTRVSYSAPQSVKNDLGHLAYVLEGVRDLSNLRSYRALIATEEEAFDGQFLFGAVTNSTSVGGFMKLQKEQVVLDDGRFELLLIPTPANGVELQNLIRSLLLRDFQGAGIIFRHAACVTVESEEPFPWTLDGEYAAGAEKIEIRNLERRLEFSI